jgi:hypothetical protein
MDVGVKLIFALFDTNIYLICKLGHFIFKLGDGHYGIKYWIRLTLAPANFFRDRSVFLHLMTPMTYLGANHLDTRGLWLFKKETYSEICHTKKLPRLKVSGFFISYVLTLGTPRVSDRHETIWEHYRKTFGHYKMMFKHHKMKKEHYKMVYGHYKIHLGIIKGSFNSKNDIWASQNEVWALQNEIWAIEVHFGVPYSPGSMIFGQKKVISLKKNECHL